MATQLSIQLGRLIVVAGIVLVVIGLVLMAGSRVGFFGLGRLPGDLSFHRKNVSLYVPIVTCVVLSLVVTLLLWLISLFGRR